MAHGKRWNIEIHWLDEDGHSAITTYNDDSNENVLYIVAIALKNFYKSTKHDTITDVFVDMKCYTCNYDSETDTRTFVGVPTYCKCDMRE
jgi:hypothetical protein